LGTLRKTYLGKAEPTVNALGTEWPRTAASQLGAAINSAVSATHTDLPEKWPSVDRARPSNMEKVSVRSVHYRNLTARGFVR